MKSIKKNAEFVGVFSQPTDQKFSNNIFYHFTLTITEVNAREKTFRAEINWPDNNNSKTKAKGKFNSNNVYIVEYDLIEGSGVSFPTIYEGKVVGTSISGIAKHANYQGTFFLDSAKK